MEKKSFDEGFVKAFLFVRVARGWIGLYLTLVLLSGAGILLTLKKKATVK